MKRVVAGGDGGGGGQDMRAYLWNRSNGHHIDRLGGRRVVVG